MSKKFTVRDFLSLDVVKKRRLMEKDPEQYNKLVAAAKSSFDPETDHEALAELSRNPKTKHLAGKGE